jgi:L-threonylcarbamoyladenylate synthase
VTELGPEQAAAFERCLAAEGVVVFPSDTVYGLACAPDSRHAVERLYWLKGRPPDKPAAVMFFALDAALDVLPELPPRTRNAFERLLPGPVTVLLRNPERRFPLACGPDPSTLGVRVPAFEHGLREVRTPVLQSSANRSGGPDPRRLADVPPAMRAAADLVLDGGELPGTPSTVLDLRTYETAGEWRVLREGALPSSEIEAALSES